MEQRLVQEIEMLYSQACHALGDPKRLMILYVLSHQPRFVGELATELDIPQPTVSRHLKVLRESGMVEATRDGTAVQYALSDTRVIQALDLLRAVLRDRMQKQAHLAEFSALNATLEASEPEEVNPVSDP
jgi:DNA-binding transcriptional ArsR family regulator